MQSGQLKGINAALGVELCSRSYKTKDRGRVQVESKLDMKRRIGKSPDLGDAALLCLEVCRRRMNLNSMAQSSSSSGENGMKRTIQKMSKKLLAMRRY